MLPEHHDVIKWKHFPHYCPFVQGIHWSLVNSPHKGQWHGNLMFSLICAWINGWVKNHEASDLRRHHTHYDVIVMIFLGIAMHLSWTHCDPWHHMATKIWVSNYIGLGNGLLQDGTKPLPHPILIYYQWWHLHASSFTGSPAHIVISIHQMNFKITHLRLLPHLSWDQMGQPRFQW